MSTVRADDIFIDHDADLHTIRPRLKSLKPCLKTLVFSREHAEADDSWGGSRSRKRRGHLRGPDERNATSPRCLWYDVRAGPRILRASVGPGLRALGAHFARRANSA